MILLFGGKGSIGRRYQAILKYLDQPFEVCDLGDKPNWSQAEKVMIATPTAHHFELCMEASEREIPFLCEKPLSQNLEECRRINEKCFGGYVVNNYAFLTKSRGVPTSISYDFFNTGRDGLVWDVCQLIHLAKLWKGELEIKTESPIWTFEWNGLLVPYREIEMSYVHMVKAFLDGITLRLWNLPHALQMSEECALAEEKRRLQGYESSFGYSGTDGFVSAARKNISVDRSEEPAPLGL